MRGCRYSGYGVFMSFFHIKKNKNSQAICDRESELIGKLINPRLKNRDGMNAGGVQQIMISFCFNGNVISKTFKSNAKIKIGRSNENNITIPDNTVSLRHCEIDAKGERVVIRDLNSKNHTKVKRKNKMFLIDSKSGFELSSGDIIKAGDIELWITLKTEVF